MSAVKLRSVLTLKKKKEKNVALYYSRTFCKQNKQIEIENKKKQKNNGPAKKLKITIHVFGKKSDQNHQKASAHKIQDWHQPVQYYLERHQAIAAKLGKGGRALGFGGKGKQPFSRLTEWVGQNLLMTDSLVSVVPLICMCLLGLWKATTEQW